MVLSNDNKRSKIMGIILKSPAVIYRQLLRFTCVSNGLLSYILRNLETSQHMVVNRGDCKRTTDYFPKNMGTKEARVMTSLANNTNREIV
jgi:predicted transcriptional regulator